MPNEFICECHSPVCDMTALVGRDENAYYFYLMESPEVRMQLVRAIWLCNRRPAPDAPETDGTGSMCLPKDYITHDPAGMELDPDSLRILWYASGDCAAVFDKNGLLAAIPPYSGEPVSLPASPDGFPVFSDPEVFTGYSRYIRRPCRYGFPMSEEDARTVEGWIRYAGKQWAGIGDEENWKNFQDACAEAYAPYFGMAEHLLQLQENRRPYKRLWMSRKNGICYNLTIGMSLVEVPGVWRQFGKHFGEHARMELGFACKESCGQAAGQMVPVMDRLVMLPWEEMDYLGHGHTIDYDGLPGYAGLLLLDAAEIRQMPNPPLPTLLGNTVRLHWLVPVKAREMQQIREGEKGLARFLRSVWFPEAVHIFNG